MDQQQPFNLDDLLRSRGLSPQPVRIVEAGEEWLAGQRATWRTYETVAREEGVSVAQIANLYTLAWALLECHRDEALTRTIGRALAETYGMQIPPNVVDVTWFYNLAMTVVAFVNAKRPEAVA